MLVTMEMAKLVLDAGFTAGRGAAAAKPRLDVVAQRFINEGRFPGPRYLAAGPEITTVGGLGDSAPSHIPHEGLNLGIVVSGPEEVRRTVRTLIKYGVDSIKLNLSGEEITGMGAEETPMSEEEVAMAAAGGASCRNKVLCGACPLVRLGQAMRPPRHPEHLPRLLRRRGSARHARGGQGQALRRAGHRLADQHRAPRRANGASSRARRCRIEYERELEMCVETMKKMHRRGIRVCIGGDYGFAWTPQGTNAKDIQTFVEMLGFSPMEAILAGDQIWRRDHGHGRRARP